MAVQPLLDTPFSKAFLHVTWRDAVAARRKKQRIILAAQMWLGGAGRRHANQPCRFDAILLDRLDPARIDWIRGAFDAS